MGALYGFCNPVSGYRMRVNQEKCVSCGQCQKVCGMDIKVWQNPNSMECIRCGQCRQVCPTGAITTTWGDLRRSLSRPDPQSAASAAIEPAAADPAAPVPDVVEKPAGKGANAWMKVIGILMSVAALAVIGVKLFTLFASLVYGLAPDNVLTLWVFGPYFLPLFCAILLFKLGLKMFSGKDDIRLTHQLNWITLGSVLFVAVVYFVFGLFVYGAAGMNLLTAFGNAVYLITDDWASYLPLVVLTLIGAFVTKTDSQ